MYVPYLYLMIYLGLAYVRKQANLVTIEFTQVKKLFYLHLWNQAQLCQNDY